MRVAMATSPGHGRPNEDFAGAAPGVAVLLDGAGIPGTEAICRHGVAWYSHSLGAALLARLAQEAAGDLADALADSIDQVAGLHRHTCDVTHPSSPQATVAMVRFGADRVDYLVLADVVVAMDTVAGPRVITDPRELEVRDEVTAPLEGLRVGSPAYERALPSVIAALRARRNTAGGYWIAKDDPGVAEQAVVGSVPSAGLRGVVLLSNGAARLVEPYRLASWSAVLDLVRDSGPDELLHRLRAAEATQDGEPDDATVVHCW